MFLACLSLISSSQMNDWNFALNLSSFIFFFYFVTLLLCSVFASFFVFFLLKKIYELLFIIPNISLYVHNAFISLQFIFIFSVLFFSSFSCAIFSICGGKTFTKILSIRCLYEHGLIPIIFAVSLHVLYVVFEYHDAIAEKMPKCQTWPKLFSDTLKYSISFLHNDANKYFIAEPIPTSKS